MSTVLKKTKAKNTLEQNKLTYSIIAILLFFAITITGCLKEYEVVPDEFYITLDEVSEIIHHHLLDAGFQFTLLDSYDRKEVTFATGSVGQQNTATLVLINDEVPFNIAIVDKFTTSNFGDFRRLTATNTARRLARENFENTFDISINFVFLNTARIYPVDGVGVPHEDIVEWRYEQIQEIIESVIYFQSPGFVGGYSATRQNLPINRDIGTFRYNKGMSYETIISVYGPFTGFIKKDQLLPYYAIGDLFLILHFTFDYEVNQNKLSKVVVANEDEILGYS